eukprot:Hpha_TRINITY_DN16422_c2_g3::TRINITY_DN16422_c2_g3_i2::g.163636::m.163636
MGAPLLTRTTSPRVTRSRMVSFSIRSSTVSSSPTNPFPMLSAILLRTPLASVLTARNSPSSSASSGSAFASAAVTSCSRRALISLASVRTLARPRRAGRCPSFRLERVCCCRCCCADRAAPVGEISWKHRRSVMIAFEPGPANSFQSSTSTPSKVAPAPRAVSSSPVNARRSSLPSASWRSPAISLLACPDNLSSSDVAHPTISSWRGTQVASSLCIFEPQFLARDSISAQHRLRTSGFSCCSLNRRAVVMSAAASRRRFARSQTLSAATISSSSGISVSGVALMTRLVSSLTFSFPSLNIVLHPTFAIFSCFLFREGVPLRSAIKYRN